MGWNTISVQANGQSFFGVLEGVRSRLQKEKERSRLLKKPECAHVGSDLVMVFEGNRDYNERSDRFVFLEGR